MTDVTTEALQMVKSALSTFQTDISGLSMRAMNDMDAITTECQTYIKQTKSDIDQVETLIDSLEAQIFELDEKIQQASEEYNHIQNEKIPRLNEGIQAVELRISSLKSQIASLRSMSDSTDSNDAYQNAQDMINELERQISSCEMERRRLENEVSEAYKRKSDLSYIISSAKSEKAKKEEELSVQKNRCYKLKDKLERLSMSYSRVEGDLYSYVSATRRFENNASERTQRNTGAVEKCIDSIEQYLSVSL